MALTAYSALCTFGNLNSTNCSGKDVLVLGGSGGVGSFAIQLLKLWNASVVATCSEEKVEWLENTLFVDQAIPYDDTLQMSALTGRFDFVLDCGAYDRTSLTHCDIVEQSIKYLKPHSRAVYVTLSPPILSNTDQHGIVKGTAQTLLEAGRDTLKSLINLNSSRWAVFLPNHSALKYVTSLYSDESIIPQVSSVFGFDQVPEAYQELQNGKARGKVVVDINKSSSGIKKLESGKQ